MKKIIWSIFFILNFVGCLPQGNILSEDGLKTNLGNNPNGNNGTNKGAAVSNPQALFVASYEGQEAIFEIKDQQNITKQTNLPQHSSLNSAVMIGDKIYYSLSSLRFDATGISEVYELNTLDGVTKKISQFHSNSSSGVESIAKVGSVIYATVRSNGNGFELYKYQNGQWQLVKDIESGVVGSFPAFYKELNNKLYFAAYQKSSGMELWNNQSDASLNANIISGQSSSHAMPWFVANGKIYLTAKSGTKYELQSVDEAGTVKVEVQSAGAAEYGSNPLSAISFLGGVASSCLSDATGREFCFASAGSNTWKIQDVFSGSRSSNPKFLTVYKDEVYFQAEADQGIELYKSDGNNLKLVKDIFSGSANSYPENLWVLKDKLYFSATDTSGTSMFSFDGQNVVKITLNQKQLLNSRSLLNPSR